MANPPFQSRGRKKQKDAAESCLSKIKAILTTEAFAKSQASSQAVIRLEDETKKWSLLMKEGTCERAAGARVCVHILASFDTLAHSSKKSLQESGATE